MGRRFRARSVGLLLLAAAAFAGRAASAPEARIPDESLSLGFCWAGPVEGHARVRNARLAGLPGAFVLTTPIAWGSVQTAAPNPRPVFRWEAVDALVDAWQEAGFSVVPVLTTGAPWACLPPEECDLLRRAREVLDAVIVEALLRDAPGTATPPRADTWPLWERFVEELVERYDGDGILDMKGLRAPIRYVQVLDRVVDAGSWLGGAEDYLRLLHHANEAARRASDVVRIVHGGVTFLGLGHAPWPDDHELSARTRKLLGPMPDVERFLAQRSIDLAKRTLEMPRLFRAVAVTGDESLVTEAADLGYVRSLLDRAGRGTTEVWLEGSPARKHSDSAGPEEQALRRRWLPVARSPDHSDHGPARVWLERGIAFDLVRTASLARLAGARRTFVAVLAEVPPQENLVVSPPAGGWERTASWYAAGQWIRRTAGSASARELAVGSEARAVLFEFPASHATPWEILLLRDPDRSWAGDPKATADHVSAVTLRVPSGTYRVEETSLADGDTVSREVEAAGGALTIQVSPAPLWVVPLRVQGPAPR